MFEVSEATVLAGVLWTALGLYGLSTGWWLVEATLFARRWEDDGERRWGAEDVQVRILTVDAREVVQGTIDAVPEAVDDVHVVAERPMEVEGATVHVVPESFDCEATNKGRAVEWARRTVPCDREYVLYLDEDTLMTRFDGLPDADVVQFTELPLFTGPRLAYLCEVFRVGYQFEQRGFHRLTYPLYAWGGGIAVRRRVEEAVTWDARTITEDTNFVWRAARDGGLSYRLVDGRFRNQAPPSLRSMFRQRRRWMSGSITDGGLLPVRYRPLYFTRVVVWALSPLVPLLAACAYLLPRPIPGLGPFTAATAALLGVLFVHMALGARTYEKHPLAACAYLLLTPLAVSLHAVGALWGTLRPVEEFEVTEKVTLDEIEEVHPELEEGEIEAHDGRGSLFEELAD
ncbi:glycosyltransferase [Halobium palmae]|uniref:Glycosyltransferase n=1 Tax=Halobium palmae TaxID=1776492 RepID=A0ABD5S1R8_9EURY